MRARPVVARTLHSPTSARRTPVTGGGGGRCGPAPSRARANTTTRVNLGPGGVQAESGAGNPAISADGRHVAFTSHATNLVPGDTNGVTDVFVHDRTAGVTTRVSVGPGGVQATGHSERNLAISADGRFVAFSSSAANLVAGDTNGVDDVFVHDRLFGETTRVSVATGGGQAAGSWTYLDDLSADGRYVAFSSSATNLVPGDTDGDYDVFVHDRATGVTTRVSLASGGAQTEGDACCGSLSDDGRYVSFSSWATNLVAGDTNGYGDVFVHNRLTGDTSRVSVATWGGQANYYSYGGALSADGRIVVFASAANNLAYGDSNGLWDVFAHDRLTRTTTRVSVGPGGLQATAHSGGPTFPPPAVSADGRYVTFMSNASNLVAGDTNGVSDVFVHDRVTATTARVSVGSGGVQANAWSREAAVNADGRYVAFLSDATNLVAGDTGPHRDVFVHDLDADGDSLLASWESAFGLNPLAGTGDDGASGDPDGDGLTNAQEYAAGTHPRGFQRRYLAEGATSLSFLDTRLAVLNPGGSPASVLLRFLETDGSTSALLVPVSGMTRATVDVKTHAGLLDAEFSTVIESDVAVVVDRLMSWDVARLRRACRDGRCRTRVDVVSRRGGDAQRLQSVLPPPEPERRRRAGARALPAAEWRAAREDLHAAADLAQQHLGQPGGLPRPGQGAGRHRCVSRVRVHQQSAHHRRARDVSWTCPARRSGPGTRARV